MLLKLDRFGSGPAGTLGLLSISGRFECFTLEDPPKDRVKIAGDTRIPAGTYRMTLRTEGGFHGRYRRRFGDMHNGMLWLRDVPEYKWVLIHLGNTKKHTRGCLLVGEGAVRSPGGGDTVSHRI